MPFADGRAPWQLDARIAGRATRIVVAAELPASLRGAMVGYALQCPCASAAPGDEQGDVMARIDDYGLRGLVLAGESNSPVDDRLRWERTQVALADFRREKGGHGDLGEFYRWLTEDGAPVGASAVV